MIDSIQGFENPIADLADAGKPVGLMRRLHGVDGKKEPDQLEKIAKDFEGLFVHQILKQMKDTVAELEPEDEEDSSGEQIKSMYWTFMADAITKQGGFGFWKQIYQQMEQSQPVENEASSNMDVKL